MPSRTAEAEAALRAQIARLRGLGKSLAAEAAPAVADALAEELKSKAAAGMSPAGVPWAPTQAGGRPLQGAAGALRVGAVGGSVVVRLSGADAMHSTGRGRGRIVRQVVPTEVTPGMGRAIQRSLSEWFQRKMA